MNFLRETKAQFPNHFYGVKILELGSIFINGSPRKLFHNCDYLGVDWREGPDVDHVSFAHELEIPDETFHTIVSTEMFEHDRYAELSFANALRMLKKTGLFIFTCANEKRQQHNLDAGIGNWYKGIRKGEILLWLLNYESFSRFYLEDKDEDLRGWVIK